MSKNKKTRFKSEQRTEITKEKKWNIINVCINGANALVLLVICITGIIFTKEYNEKQLELAKKQLIAATIDKLAIDDIGSLNTRSASLYVPIFQEYPSEQLVRFMQQEDEEMRTAAVIVMSLLGPTGIENLYDYLDNENIFAKFKSEGLKILKQIDNEKFLTIKRKILKKMKMKEKKEDCRKVVSNCENENYDKFVSKEIIISLYELGQIDFPNSCLIGFDFSGTNMSKVNFNKSDFFNITFGNETKLIGAKFEGAYFYKPRFINTDVDGAHFDGAEFVDPEMQGLKHLKTSYFINTRFNSESENETLKEKVHEIERFIYENAICISTDEY